MGSALLGTGWYNFQPPTPPLSTTMQCNIRDRWKARWEHDASSQFYDFTVG